MNRPFSLPFVIGVSGLLAIDGKHFSRRQATHRTRPVQEALLELFRVETSEHPIKGVMTRDALRQCQKGFYTNSLNSDYGCDPYPLGSCSASTPHDSITPTLRCVTLICRIDISQSCLALPSVLMPTQPSAPQITSRIAIVRISMSKLSLLRSMRGSSRSAKSAAMLV